MQYFRDGGASHSPPRLLYGKKEGQLILPLDLCIVEMVAGTEQPRFPNTPGQYNAQPVRRAGGGTLGRLAHYDWPPANAFAVVPTAVITPDSALPIASVPEAHAPMPLLHINDVVELEFLDDNFQAIPTGILGAIQEVLVTRMYPDLGHRVIVHRVDFGTSLQDISHGHRVVLASSRALLGMLFVTQNQGPEHCDAWVYPAHLI